MTNKFGFTRRRFLLGLLALPCAPKAIAQPMVIPPMERSFTTAEIGQWLTRAEISKLFRFSAQELRYRADKWAGLGDDPEFSREQWRNALASGAVRITRG